MKKFMSDLHNFIFR